MYSFLVFHELYATRTAQVYAIPYFGNSRACTPATRSRCASLFNTMGGRRGGFEKWSVAKLVVVFVYGVLHRCLPLNSLTVHTTSRTLNASGLRPLFPPSFKPTEDLTAPVDATDGYFGVTHSSDPLTTHTLRRLIAYELDNPSKQQSHAIPFYGGVDRNVYFFTSLLVGTPAQRQSVILDTGSSLLGFPCTYCLKCGRHMDAPFNPTASSSHKWLSCFDSHCYSASCTLFAPSRACAYMQDYSEGSKVAGAYFSDVIAIGEATSHSKFVRYDHIGCHTEETRLFVSQTANGIFGLAAPKASNQRSLIDVLFNSQNTQTRLLSLCAADDGGVMHVGGYNSSFHIPSLSRPAPHRRVLSAIQSLSGDITLRPLLEAQTAINNATRAPSLFSKGTTRAESDSPFQMHRRWLQAQPTGANLLRNTSVSRSILQKFTSNSTVPVVWVSNISPRSYAIRVQYLEILFGAYSRNLSLSTTCLVDSGSTYTYFPSAVIQDLRHAFGELCASNPSGFCSLPRQPTQHDLCWTRVAPSALPHMYPSLILHLPDKAQVEWRPESYFSTEIDDNEWCIQADSRSNQDCVLGMPFFKHKNVIMDQDRKLIGFVEASCPSGDVKQRPDFHPSLLAPTSLPTMPVRGTTQANAAWPAPGDNTASANASLTHTPAGPTDGNDVLLGNVTTSLPPGLQPASFPTRHYVISALGGIALVGSCVTFAWYQKGARRRRRQSYTLIGSDRTGIQTTSPDRSRNQADAVTPHLTLPLYTTGDDDAIDITEHDQLPIR